MRRGILWKEIKINPAIQVKYGIRRELYPLEQQKTKSRYKIHYSNNYIKLKGKWDNSPGFGSLLKFTLKNISASSLRITRLIFPAENGLDKFLKGFKPADISFYRNGYQSWSLSRSYKLKDKPLRPWLQVISLASSNMANLPSNNPGNLSSEMYTVICNLAGRESFFVGQGPPFNQFFYIRLIVHSISMKTNYFELVFDFGRKMLLPGESIELDGIIMAQGKTEDLLSRYFHYLKSTMNIRIPEKNFKGWSSWYYYYNNIDYKKINKNLGILHSKKIPLDIFQIDDGYQKMVGDWLDVKQSFNGRMKELADTIKKRGFRPGIWIAPFIADRRSHLVKNHPEYILRNEYGIPLAGGINFFWPGWIYYALDITHPRFEEYIKKVINTIVHEWGFTYLKLDFMYCACLRGGNHKNLRLSRAEVLKHGINIIKKTAGENVLLSGCGMPLSPGIGIVDSMRISTDTAPFWHRFIRVILRTETTMGVHDSIRNNFTRCMMNRNLWINDPDCLMIRNKKTKLNNHERLTQINAIIITGGTLFLSDNMEELHENVFTEIEKIIQLCDNCYKGTPITLDLMDKGFPEIIYNTRGYLGIFNVKNRSHTKVINVNSYNVINKKYSSLYNIWSGEIIKIPAHGVLTFKKMPPHSSLLFQFG